MDKKCTVVTFYAREANVCVDLQVPLYITAGDLAHALQETFGLSVPGDDPGAHCMRSRYPIALLHPEHTLEEAGIRRGSLLLW